MKKFRARLVEAAMAYPEVTEDHPWGETVFKVKGKVFVFMGVPSEDLSFSLKLPSSSGMALMLPFAEPTGYGLGKAGWVTVRFTKGSQLPEETLLEWLDESYRAIAPKRIVKALPVK